jgi:hypothetical protein
MLWRGPLGRVFGVPTNGMSAMKRANFFTCPICDGNGEVGELVDNEAWVLVNCLGCDGTGMVSARVFLAANERTPENAVEWDAAQAAERNAEAEAERRPVS